MCPERLSNFLFVNGVWFLWGDDVTAVLVKKDPFSPKQSTFAGIVSVILHMMLK